VFLEAAMLHLYNDRHGRLLRWAVVAAIAVVLFAFLIRSAAM
jgi:hypothetical protein